MRNTFTRKEFSQAVSCAVALGVFSGNAFAQARDINEPARVVDAVYEKVALDAKVLFDSGSSVVRRAGRDTLDKFVVDIHGLDTQRIAAIGYADRTGSDASNQILSEQRVDAVKTYLVGKGINAQRVQTSAMGATQPTTSAGECKDASNAKNAACRQPDRHVVIEVSGTRIAKHSALTPALVE